MKAILQNLSPTQAVHLLHGYQIDLKDLMRVTLTELLAKKIIKIYPDKATNVLVIEDGENHRQILSCKYFLFFRYKMLFQKEVYENGKRYYKSEVYPFRDFFRTIYREIKSNDQYRKTIIQSLRGKGFYPSSFWGKLFNGDDLSKKGWQAKKELQALKSKVENEFANQSLSKEEKAKWLTTLGLNSVILAPSVLTNFKQESQTILYTQDNWSAHLEASLDVLDAINTGFEVADASIEIAGAALEGIGTATEAMGSAVEGVGGLLSLFG